MSKHTQTPWAVEYVGSGGHPANPTDVYEILSADGHARVAEYVSGDDATFIVRAANSHDELVKALQHFVGQWNACGPNSDFGRYFKNVREAALSALRAAGVEP